MERPTIKMLDLKERGLLRALLFATLFCAIPVAAYAEVAQVTLRYTSPGDFPRASSHH